MSHGKLHNLGDTANHGNGAQWTSLYTTVTSSSGNWQNTYTTYNTSSAIFMDISGSNSSIQTLNFNNVPTTIGTLTGSMYWDVNNHTVSTVLENGVILQNGQELHIYGKNVSSQTINNGQPVSVVAQNGQFTALSAVSITSPAAYAYVGLATQTILAGEFGYVTRVGVVRDINTDNLVEGMPVYVSSSGTLTSTYPTVPNYVINVGMCEYKHQNQGRINVISLIVPRLADLSDIDGIPLTTNGQIAIYHTASGGFFDFDKNINDYTPLSMYQSTSGVYTTVNSTSATWGGAVSGSFANGITVGNGTTAVGIKIDTNDPSYGWRDITGVITYDYAGGDAPVVAALRTPTRAYWMDNNDLVDCSFHMPHDYVQGSDLFLHFHWSHDAATSISGPLSCVMSSTYARRSNGVDYVFPTAKKHYITYQTVHLSATPQYSHRVDEVQITSQTDTATSYAVSGMEVDGVIIVNVQLPVIPTMVGQAGAPTTINRIPLLHVDLHYQSHNLGTKNKAFPFYL